MVARGVGAHEFVTVVALTASRMPHGSAPGQLTRSQWLPISTDAVAALMRPAAARVPWYRTRWAWAAGIAGATAAIAIPLTLIIAGGDAPTTATVVGPGGRL